METYLNINWNKKENVSELPIAETDTKWFIFILFVDGLLKYKIYIHTYKYILIIYRQLMYILIKF